ncbi:MAG: 4Fe-4S dicluster domain-containing protein [Desulfobulbaceae bacterium]|nr:4Fe-4S dicluster domain-containing protein [Desulfobulbaceae bacterium]
MQTVMISPAELDALIEKWQTYYAVYVPALAKPAAATTDWAPGWRRFVEGEPLILPVGPTPASVKTFYFPQPETLLSFSLEENHPDKGAMREPVKSQGMQVVLGVRPCDAASVLLNQLPFIEDPLYMANCQRTALVGFTCTSRLSTCFCTEMGGSPLHSAGLDLALSSLEDGFILEVLSEKGEILVAGCNLVPASASDMAGLTARRQGAAPGDSVQLQLLRSCALNRLYEAPMWQALGEACINCGACTFICPTCFCFDIQDEVVQGQGRRIRYWDSCMFPLYSQHTSGHNPRGKKLQRTRNRFLHKLKYFPDRFGPFSCVGCGRCIGDCPVNIDIREVLSDLVRCTELE